MQEVVEILFSWANVRFFNSKIKCPIAKIENGKDDRENDSGNNVDSLWTSGWEFFLGKPRKQHWTLQVCSGQQTALWSGLQSSQQLVLLIVLVETHSANAYHVIIRYSIFFA